MREQPVQYNECTASADESCRPCGRTASSGSQDEVIPAGDATRWVISSIKGTICAGGRRSLLLATLPNLQLILASEEAAYGASRDALELQHLLTKF
jgi:hypothetical protein